ncbi:MAG: tripartite tricarboxylate transporter permease [Nanoarchaeota archaeon]|nr:tripartite tricarboxylate transporter permease [Nanoarchaeota archaeon]
MLIHILLALFLGVLAGCVTGLIPGIHVNLISLLLVSSAGYLLGFASPLTLSVFIISMAVTHTFLDAIPSIFLGAPDAAMALAVLPGHKLLLEGKGYEAVKLTVIGSLLSLIAVLILIPLMIPFVPALYSFINPYIGYILIFVVVFMILKENGINNKYWALVLFLISGILGLIVLNISNLGNPLFHMLSGLFGLSTLIISLNQSAVIPKQWVSESIFIKKGEKVRAVSAAVFSGSLTALFPGLGAAQAAVIGMQIVGKISEYAFMVLIGGINTVNFVFSLVTLYALQKARNGAVVAVLDVMKMIDLTQLIILLLSTLIAGCIAAFLALKISKFFANHISKINYKVLCFSIIILIAAISFIFGGFLGIFILFVSTAIGLIAPLTGVKRSNAMGCLLLPVILYFIL